MLLGGYRKDISKTANSLSRQQLGVFLCISFFLSSVKGMTGVMSFFFKQLTSLFLYLGNG